LHVPLTHAEAEQSLFVPQPLPTAQFAVQVPPQSTSVSFPFLTPSVHVAATHLPPLEHLPLAGSAQSVFALQFLPTAHVGPQPPPQSTSVSVPFRLPSPHAAATHAPALHTFGQAVPSSQVPSA
jgi:hypothetical protein